MFQKPRWKRYFYFVILSLSMFLTGGTLFGSSIVYAQESFHKQTELIPIDIVLDIDWTILNPTTEALAEAVTEGVFRHSTGVYRYSKHIVDFMMTLHSMPGVRVSFYSGGEADRNHAVVKDLY